MERTIDTELGIRRADGAGGGGSDTLLRHRPIADNAEKGARGGSLSDQMRMTSVAATGIMVALAIALALPAATQATPALHGSGIITVWHDAMSFTFHALLEVSRLFQDTTGDLIQRITDEAEGWTFARY